MNPQAELNLRGIHWPEAVSWWPPAPGWWISALILLLVITLLVFLVRRWLKPKPVKQARDKLMAVVADWKQNQDSAAFLQQVSGLIRQVAMTYQGRARAAGLYGPEWWQEITSMSKNHALEPPVMELLTVSQYQAEVHLQEQQVLMVSDQVLSWLKGLPGQVKHA